MATITPTVTSDTYRVNATWAGMAAADVGAAIEAYNWEWQTVQVVGGNGTLHIDGSNDGTNWFVLLQVSAAGFVTISQPRPRYIRPVNQPNGVTVDVLFFGSRHYGNG